MPTVIRKSLTSSLESRRLTKTTLNWQARSQVWNPPTDVYETDEQIVIRMEIAGVQEEDLEVVIQERLLSINGVRFDSEERKAYHQMEIPFGRFSINMEIPVKIKAGDILAEYKNGFLIIHIPKDK